MEDGAVVYEGYRVKPLGTFSMLHIQGPSSGPVPKELDGHFTSMKEAKVAIDRYLNSLTGRGRKKNVKEASTSTD